MTLLIVYALLSIGISFMCSVLEAALLSVTPTYIKIKTKEGKSYAKTLTKFKQDIDKPLIAILSLNTIAHTVGAILVGVQAEKTFGNGNNAVGIVSTIMTILILVLSEIIPKTIGAKYWKNLGNFTAKILTFILIPLRYTGILWVLMLFTKLIGGSTHANQMSKEEFVALTEAAEKEGVFEENESKFIKNLMVYKSILAKDVMTPFSVAVTAEENISIQQFYDQHKNLKFSRIPIYKDRPNNITGFILKDDFLEEIINDHGGQPLSSLKRELLITEAQTSIQHLFNILIEKRAHIAVVTDEFGNTVGVITMEDLIETLLGLEIMDESDSIADMQHLARKNWERRAKRLGIISHPEESEEKTSTNSDEKSTD
ncbi:MAG: CNNM domain-containing protein [Mesonia sp.]|uniref:CNNM domain-containing protein n=1 Tax=Mesonia sp. TaxID=1960830 RepID=UPI003242DAC0